MTYSKKQLLQGLRYQLAHDTEKAKKALILIYNNQTQAEQSALQTVEFNGVGFTSLDAEILSSISAFYLNHKFVTPRQLAIVKRLVPKYAGQVLASSIERGLIVQISPRRWEILDREPKV
jgi:hypothetical protein